MTSTATTARRSTSSGRSSGTWPSAGSAGATCWSGIALSSGAAAALAPVIAACTGSQRHAASAARVRRAVAPPSARRRRARLGRARRRPTPEPTPVPDPRGRAVHLQLGRLHGRERRSRRSRRSTGSRSRTTSSTTTTRCWPRSARAAAATTSRSRPRSTSRACSRDGLDPGARPVADPEHRQPRRGVGRTPATTRATSTRSRTCGGRPASPTTRPRSTEKLTAGTRCGTRSTSSTSRSSTTCARRSPPPLFLLGKDPNTTDDADLDAALALLQEQKPLRAHLHDRRHRRPLDRRRVDRPRLGLDVYQVVTRAARRSSSTSPRRAASAAPTRRSCSPTPSTRSPRSCS